MRVLFVSDDSKLFHMQRLAESITKCGADTQVLRFRQYGYLTQRFTLVPSTRLLTKIAAFHPDLIFTDVYHYDSWVSRLLARPVLAHMRGDFWSEYLYHERVRQKTFSAGFKTLWIRFVVERGIDFAHTVLPICNWLATQVKLHRPKKRIKVLYQPIELETWREEEGGEEMVLDHPAVISVFDFNVLPKVLGLVRFLDVARTMPEVNFYVAGSGSYLSCVMAQNPPKNMKFLGRLPYPSGVKSFLKEGDLYVHPSGQDACPLSLMEAQLMGKPIIASNVGGIPEVVSNPQRLLDCEDTEGWVRSIKYLLEHPGEWEQIGSEGRRFVENKFAMETISRELFEYIREVV